MPRTASSAEQPTVRPAFLVAAGGALTVAVGLLAWSSLGGDDSTDVALPAAVTAQASATPAASTNAGTDAGTEAGTDAAAASESGTVSSARTASGSALRNPFVPVVRAKATPAPSATAAPSTATAAVPAASAAPVPVTTAAPVPSAAPTPTAPPSPSPSAAAPVTVKLVAVASDNAAATFLVARKTYVAVPGATFADSFTLERLEGGSCATIGYGTTKKDVCEGEALTVELG